MTTPDVLGHGGTVGLTIADSAARVDRLGFVVVNGATPGRPGGANLIVALRATPSLAHFDPELIQFWETTAGRGRQVELTRRAQPPPKGPYAWGTIRVVDRLNVFNSFLSFGGVLRAEAISLTETLAVFGSPAPIVRWTGHSQEVDPLAGAVGELFARIRVPIDFEPGAEGRIALASPVALYSILLDRLERRYAASESLRAAHRAWAAEVDREARRVRETDPAEWEAGLALARDLGLDRA